MFYLRYLRAELLRRRGRTIVTLLGLAVGVGLVIAIASLSKGLDEAQSATLDPLAGIGTDLTVTRTAEEDAGGGPFGGGGARDVVEANQAVITDLSKLGKAGTQFVHDFFLPGAQLTFTQAQANEIADARRRRSGLRRADAPGGAPGREGAEDRREDPDRRRPDRRRPRDLAADRGRAGEDPGLPHEARLPGSRPGAGAESRPGEPGRRRLGGGQGGDVRVRRRRVRAMPPRADAALPRDDHDAARDAAAGARPAADRHQERVVHDRRRPAGRPDDGPRHRCSGERGPLPEGRPRGARLRDLCRRGSR